MHMDIWTLILFIAPAVTPTYVQQANELESMKNAPSSVRLDSAPELAPLLSTREKKRFKKEQPLAISYAISHGF